MRHEKPAEIARKIGKHRSVISREMARNALIRDEYKPLNAHLAYQQRKAPNAQKATSNMHQVIKEGLQKQWSPDQINGRSQTQGQPMLSRAAIYTHIWHDQRRGGDLYKHLRHASKPYRKRYGKPDGRTKAAKRASKPSIDQRPAIVDEKTRFGDWELDTVIGPNHKGVLVTLTERRTNYLLMRRTADKSAQEVRKAITACLQESGLSVHTLTSDNGTEFADYEQIAIDLKAAFYRSGDPVCSSLSRLGAGR